MEEEKITREFQSFQMDETEEELPAGGTIVMEPIQEAEEEEILPEEEPPEEEPLPLSAAEKKRRKRQKKRDRKRRLKKIAGPTLLMIIILLISGFAFARSGFFTIEKIQVNGNSYYTKAQIKEICGAEKGMNLFSIHKRTMINLLISDPYIEHAEIERDLPNRLIIRVVESEERGAIYSDKNYYVIDTYGYVLRVSTEKPKDIPKITGFDVRKGEEGEALEVKQAKAFNDTISLINTSAKSTISYRKIKVKNGVCYAYIKKKLYIKGLPEDIEACIKSGKMEAVLYDIYEKGIKHGRITVGSDNYCVFRP